MKTLLLGVVIAAILIATVPRIRDAGHSSPTASAPAPSNITTATPMPAPGPAPSATSQKYRSPLGGNGGLGNASLAESEAGRIQVYTLTTLPAVRDGQVVRLRLSRAKFAAAPFDDKTLSISFVDADIGGTANILFPIAGAEKLDLIRGHAQTGLTFNVALEMTGLRAVGQAWRADSKTYTW